VGRLEQTMGVRATSTAEMIFEEARAPEDAVLGRPGEGLRQAMTVLRGAWIGIAAQAVGIGRAILEESLSHARAREQFKEPISSFQAVQWKLADMAAELDASELLTLRAAWLKDHNSPHEKEAAMAKMYASDTTMKASIEGVQILGGYGYCKRYPMERHMRDAKVCQIYEGTNEIMRLVIARNLADGR
ncbi:MAG: acyl-CoA dehydrogenase, partial [Deltaproteobacteria bacterium]|nr:acyl-CoA dehydrogenase [Deltaproteobacteria bacterium]